MQKNKNKKTEMQTTKAKICFLKPISNFYNTHKQEKRVKQAM